MVRLTDSPANIVMIQPDTLLYWCPYRRRKICCVGTVKAKRAHSPCSDQLATLQQYPSKKKKSASNSRCSLILRHSERHQRISACHQKALSKASSQAGRPFWRRRSGIVSMAIRLIPLRLPIDRILFSQPQHRSIRLWITEYRKSSCTNMSWLEQHCRKASNRTPWGI